MYKGLAHKWQFVNFSLPPRHLAKLRCTKRELIICRHNLRGIDDCRDRKARAKGDRSCDEETFLILRIGDRRMTKDRTRTE